MPELASGVAWHPQFMKGCLASRPSITLFICFFSAVFCGLTFREARRNSQ